MGSKGGQTTTTQSSPPPEFMQAYTNLLARGNQVADQPLQQYQGPLVAGFNPDQANAFSQVEQAAGSAMPYFNQAAQYAGLGAAPTNIQQFSNPTIQQYQNPFTQNVLDTTMANINQQNALQQGGLMSQGIRQGNAFGGDRLGLAQSALANQQDLAKNQTIAGLESQGYGQALGEFNTQQQMQLQQQANDAARAAQAAYQFGNIGQGIQGSALTGANALLSAGGLQQQLAQQQLNIPYSQFQQQQAYPFQTTNFLAGLTGSMGSLAGGSGTTTTPPPSQAGTFLGLGQLGLGAAGLFLKGGGKVPHYDVGGGIAGTNPQMIGGVPMQGGIMPIGLSPVPNIQLIHGSGPPHAPNVQNMPAPDISKQIKGFTGAMEKLTNGDTSGPVSDAVATNYINNTLNGTNPGPQPDDVGYADGGRISHYLHGGGLAGFLPSRTGISTPQINPRAFQFNPNITGSSGGMLQQHPPFMGGLGGIPGMQGGQQSPNMQPQQFGSGYNSVYALPQIPLSAMPPPNVINTVGSKPPVSGPAGGLQDGSQSGLFGGSNPLNLGTVLKTGGIVPHFQDAGEVDEADLPANAVPASFVPQDMNVEQKPERDMTPYQKAIHSVESIREPDPYRAIGPVTRSGDRAIGKYQVMANNIPGWTSEALGKPMNAAEFMNNPEAQDKVFNHKFGQYLDQYGNPQDAASMWFAGKPLAQAGNANDQYTTVPKYVASFTQALNKYSPSDPVQSGGLGTGAYNFMDAKANEDLDPHPEIDHSGDTVKINYPSTKESLDTGLPGKSSWEKLVGGEKFMSKNAALALMQSGLATMAAASRPGATALGSVGQGGMQGMQAYMQQKQLEQQQGNKAQQQQLERDKLNEVIRQHQTMTPYQQMEAQKPVPVGQTMDLYGGVHTQFGVRRPDGTFADPITGQPIIPSGPKGPSPAPGAPTSETTPPPAVKTEQGAELNPDEAKLPRNAQMAAADLTPSTANPQFLKDAVANGTMTPADAETVKAISEGRQAFPPMSRNNPRNIALSNWVHQYDPGFDQGASGARFALRKQYLGGGKASDNILSFDMTMQHVGRFLQSADKMGNYTYAPGIVNPGYNYIRSQTDPKYQDAVAGFNKDADAVASELMRATRGVGAGTLEEIRAWRNGLDPNASPVTQRAAAKEAINLLYGRIAAQGDRWNQGMRTDKDALTWLSPEAQQAFQNIYSMDTGKSLKEQGIAFADPRFARLKSVAEKAAGAKEPQAAQDSGPKVGEEKQFKQGVGVWDGTKWVPKGQP